MSNFIIAPSAKRSHFLSYRRLAKGLHCEITQSEALRDRDELNLELILHLQRRY